jgi:hypothetical protein
VHSVEYLEGRFFKVSSQHRRECFSLSGRSLVESARVGRQRCRSSLMIGPFLCVELFFFVITSL